MELPGGVADQEPERRPLAERGGRLPRLSIRTSSDGGAVVPDELAPWSDVVTPSSREMRSCKIWVGNIGTAHATEDTVAAVLSQFGSVQSCTFRDFEERDSTTWAIVTLSAESEALAATRTGMLENGWEMRVYQPSRLQSKRAHQVARRDRLRQTTKHRSLRFLRDIQHARSTFALAAEVEKAMVDYFAREGRDDDIDAGNQALMKARGTKLYLAGIESHARGRQMSYLVRLEKAARSSVATGVAIGQFLGDASRHTFELTKSFVVAPIKEKIASAANVAGSVVAADEGPAEEPDEDSEPKLDEHATVLIDTLRPILNTCLWYAATVADGNQENLKHDRRQRLLYIGSKDHELYRELKDERVVGHGHGHFCEAETLQDAYEEVKSSMRAEEAAALGWITCVVITLDADDSFVRIGQLSAELQGHATIYWYVEPASVSAGLNRVVQSCGWELVPPGMETQHAKWMIRSAALNCCEACLQLVKRTLRRLLDRHTMVVFKEIQMLVANLLVSQPWTSSEKACGKSDERVGGGSSFAKFFSTRTPPGVTNELDREPRKYMFKPSVAMQHDLLIILQLCCEGGCVEGQKVLVDSGMLRSVCDFVGSGSLETKVQRHSKIGKQLDALLLHRQALLTVTEAIQGPNVEARNVVLDTALHDTVAMVLVRMSHARHLLMKKYHEAHINNEVGDGNTNRSFSAIRASASSFHEQISSRAKPEREPGANGTSCRYEAGGVVARMLAKETSVFHIDRLGMAEIQVNQSKSGTRSDGSTSSTNLLKIEDMAGDPKEFEVELLEHVAIGFLRCCVAFSVKGDAVFDGALGDALAGERVYHSFLTQWRFHVILGEIEKQKGLAIESKNRHNFTRPSVDGTDDETMLLHNHAGRSISRRRLTLVSYWTFLDELLSVESQKHRETLEPSSWDNNGLNMLKINRVEIQMEGQLSPYYFMSTDSDDTQETLSSVGLLEHRLETMRRSQWHSAILGTDEQTGLWDYSTKHTTGQRKRNDNLDASARYWLVNLQLSRKLRHPVIPPGWVETLMIWMSVHLNSMKKARLLLVLAINCIVVLLTQDRDRIDRQNEDGHLNLFHENRKRAHNVVVYLGVVTLTLSLCSALVTVTDRRLALLAEATIEKEEARMIHNGDFRRSQYAWMFTEDDRGHAGGTKLNCYGVVHVVNHMTWRMLGLKGNIICYWKIVSSMEVVYCTWFVVTAILGLLYGNPLFYCAHMLDICGFSQELNATVSAGKTYFMRVLSLTMASFSVMYIYAAFGFWFFPRSFVDGNTGYTMSTSLYETLLFVFNFGFRSGGGIADVTQPAFAYKYRDDYYQDWEDIGNTITLGLLNVLVPSASAGEESQVGYVVYTIFRWFYDLLFFVIFVLFFSNVILVVMVDGLNDYREAVEDRRGQVSSHCIICAQHRDTVEGVGVPFTDHVRREHNVYMYLDLVATIVAKPLTEYTGAENYIARCLKRGNWDFIPFKSSLCIQRAQAAQSIAISGQPTQRRRSSSAGSEPSTSTVGAPDAADNLTRNIFARMCTLEQQVAELKLASESIQETLQAEKEARQVSTMKTNRGHELLVQLLERLPAPNADGAQTNGRPAGSTVQKAQGPGLPGSTALVDENVLAWLLEGGLTGPFAAALGTLCTSLTDLSMLTQDDVATLSQLKFIEKRRLLVALSSLPGSAIGPTDDATHGVAIGEIQHGISQGSQQLVETLQPQLEVGKHTTG